ncbi:DUF6510 family protein [Streptomyces bobili]|uniref:DUF6510 family protein n=1 Tax=Streptomyces bobili TaxID=67280 RepID=UPI003409C483
MDQCATSGPLAQLHVYRPEPGLTTRCPGCAYIALRLIREGDHIWLTMGGGTARVPSVSRRSVVPAHPEPQCRSMRNSRLVPLLDIGQWQADAACQGMASTVFFSPTGERGPAGYGVR